MIYARPDTAFEATLTNAAEGLVGVLTVEVYDPTDGSTVTAATAAGITEPRPGTYQYAGVAPTVEDSYLIRWDDQAGNVAEEELVVSGDPPVPVGPPGDSTGLTYATTDDLRGRLELDSAALPDATAKRLLAGAERRLDRLAGAWPIRPNGRKLDPTSLPSLFSIAIREATLDLAAAEQRNPAAFTPPGAKTVFGPDFRLIDAAGLPPDGHVAIRDAVDRLDALNLRALTARPRP